MKEYENYENWNDEYQDDIESQGMPLIRQGQSNSPKVLEGVFGIGDFLMPNGLVAKGCYQFLAIGCDDLWVHWAANRGGLLGFLPGSETPPGTDWLKPGVPRDGFPTVMKEGRYAPDGSVWERTIYLHSLIVAVGRPAIRLDQPICGTFAFKGKSCEIGQNFYRSQLKAVEAVIDGQARAQHDPRSLGDELGDRARAQPVRLDGAEADPGRRVRPAGRTEHRAGAGRQDPARQLQAGPGVGVGAAAGDRRPADGGAADPGLGARDAQARHPPPIGAPRIPASEPGRPSPTSARGPAPRSRTAADPAG